MLQYYSPAAKRQGDTDRNKLGITSPKVNGACKKINHNIGNV
jgi:hypothetical protein